MAYMALFVRQEDSRTELQNRIAAELREKIKNDKPLEYKKTINSVEEGTHEARNVSAVVLLIVAVVVLGVAYLLLSR